MYSCIMYAYYAAKCLTWRSISGLTDLRTEDSGKLGCRLYAGGENNNFELLKDFAVTGKCAFVLPVCSMFTARRNARGAKLLLPSVSPSVCPCVRLSVTRRYCVKTTARSTLQFAVSDSKM